MRIMTHYSCVYISFLENIALYSWGNGVFEILRVVLAWNNRLTVFGTEEKRLVVTATLTGSCLSGL